MQQGWVSVHRKIYDNWLWDDKPFSKGQAWIDMLLLANHKEAKTMIDGKVVIIPRGSFHTSILKLSDRFGWERKKTTRFLNLLEQQKMVITKRSTRGTTITIVNYGVYQDRGQLTEQPTSQQKVRPTGNAGDTNNNDNNANKDNKYNVNFDAFWKVYPRKKEKAKAYKAYCARLRDGYSEAEMLKAVTAYAEECRKSNTEEKYIKLGATFLGNSTPFTDYIKGEEHGTELSSGTTASDYYRKWL